MTDEFKKLPDSELPPGHKYDAGKPRMDLLPGFGALMEVGKVATFGANKYKDHNWRGAKSNGRYIAALIRHICYWIEGEENDQESGLSHLAHAAWNCLAILQLQKDGYVQDDRYKENRKQAMSGNFEGVYAPKHHEVNDDEELKALRHGAKFSSGFKPEEK